MIVNRPTTTTHPTPGHNPTYSSMPDVVSTSLRAKPSRSPKLAMGSNANGMGGATLLILCCLMLSKVSVAQCVSQWVRLHPQTSPSARADSRAAFDQNLEACVLFGGALTTGVNLGDTWQWDGRNWTPHLNGGPTARSAHSMWFSPASRGVELFGGFDGSRRRDLWRFSSVSWTALADSGPAGRSGAAVARDDHRGRVVVFGGLSESGVRGDTWEFDEVSWSMVASSGPVARSNTTAAFDPSRNRVVMFGGQAGTTTLGDTWEWDGANWEQKSSTGPAARNRHSMAWDPVLQRIVLFGGRADSPLSFFGDVWTWDGAAWTHLPLVGPSPRAGVAMAFDMRRSALVVFGGGQLDGSYNNETWVLSYVPVIVTGPASGSTCSASTTNFSVEAEGTGPFTYQWRVSDTTAPGGWTTLTDGPLIIDGTTWGTISDATTATLRAQPDPLTYYVANTLRFHCVVTNGCGSATSDSATLTVCACLDCSADFNQDGGIDGGDVSAFFDRWEIGQCDADVNADGGVDGSDVDTFFAAWEAGGCG